MVIAAVCQPLAASPANRVPLRQPRVEVKGLRVELGGERLDLRLVEGVRAAGEPLADPQVVEIERPRLVVRRPCLHGPSPPA